MKRTLIALALVIPLLISCSQEEPGNRNTLTGAEGYADGDAVVQSSDGTLYSVGCLQSSASLIKERGAVAMTGCQVSLNSGSIQTEAGSRGKFFSNNYAYVYYPPTYYSPSYSGYNYGSNYNNPTNNSGTNSNCYNDNRFKSDSFCSFVFGNNSGINCYYVFGYDNRTYNKYQNYYNPSCSTSCLYSYNPSACQSRCYNQVPVNYY